MSMADYYLHNSVNMEIICYLFMYYLYKIKLILNKELYNGYMK